MPTYEYACGSCAHEWEFEQSIKDAPLTECPHCQQATAKRQISRGTGFILKGSGWYSDLYASSTNKPPAKAEDASGGKASDGKPSGDAGSSSGGTSGTGGASGTGGTSGTGGGASGTGGGGAGGTGSTPGGGSSSASAAA